MDILITLAILLFSVIVHEVSHGVMAEKLGDSTARDAGRITLNPIPHIDPFGSILLPLIFLLPTLLTGTSPLVFGYAKPVPVNFENLRPRKLGMVLVSIVGPLSNFVLAALFALPLTFGLVHGVVGDYWLKATVLNVVLGTFNILPIPPLDGSKILASLLPDRIMYPFLGLERYSMVFFALLVFVSLRTNLFKSIFLPVVYLFFKIFGLQI